MLKRGDIPIGKPEIISSSYFSNVKDVSETNWSYILDKQDHLELTF